MNDGSQFPVITTVGEWLRIAIRSGGPEAEPIEIDAILDFDASSRIVGVEFINLLSNTSPSAFEGYDWRVPRDMRISFDEDCDAFYLNVDVEARRVDQSVSAGRVVLDKAGHLIAIEVRIPETRD